MAIPDTAKRSLLWVYRCYPHSKGIGFIIGNKTKYVITCAHCIDRPPKAGVVAWQKPILVQIKTLTEKWEEDKAGVMWVTGYEPYLDFAVLSCTPLHDYNQKCSTCSTVMDTETVLGTLGGFQLSNEVSPPEIITLLTHKNVELTASPALKPCHTWKNDVWIHYKLTNSQNIEGGTSGTPVFDSDGNVWGFLNSSHEKNPDIIIVNLMATLPTWLMKEISL